MDKENERARSPENPMGIYNYESGLYTERVAAGEGARRFLGTRPVQRPRTGDRDKGACVVGGIGSGRERAAPPRVCRRGNGPGKNGVSRLGGGRVLQCTPPAKLGARAVQQGTAGDAQSRGDRCAGGRDATKRFDDDDDFGDGDGDDDGKDGGAGDRSRRCGLYTVNARVGRRGTHVPKKRARVRAARARLLETL